MSIVLSIFIVSFIMFVILFTAFEAFDRLSGGQIMKLEESDPELAARLNGWLEKSDSIRSVFKLMLFILVSVLGMFSFVLVQSWTGEWSDPWKLPFIIGAIIVFWSIGEFCALLLLLLRLPLLLRLLFRLLLLLLLRKRWRLLRLLPLPR